MPGNYGGKAERAKRSRQPTPTFCFIRLFAGAIPAPVRVPLLWLSCLIFAALASCSATGYRIADLADEINATRTVGRDVVAVGDTLRITFPQKPEWNTIVRVRADGRAAFPEIDEVQVAGLTIAECDERLSTTYRNREDKSADSDKLTVELLTGALFPAGTTLTPDAVFVSGEVTTPGPVAMNGRPWTLFEAIAAAGGHRKSTANLGNTILIRRLASGTMRSWRLDADIYRWGEAPPIYLQPRDIVFVPNTAIDSVDIWVDKYIRQLIPLPTLIPAP
jgi:protein involved in polysaccharide export with SLBB domain